MLPACDTYAKELWPLGHGHPLWGPEPCLDFGEVRLGDVGYIRRGHFCFLFNTMRGPNDPINARRGVPQGFSVFSPPDLMLRHHPNEITQTQLHSRSIRLIAIDASLSAGASGEMSVVGAHAGAGLRYQCKDDSGALLLLQRPGHRTYLDCDLHIKRYIRAHIASWHAFANAHLGIGLEEKDVVFVSGFTKTTVWAEAAFDNGSACGELVVSAGGFVAPAPPVSAEFRVSMARCVEASVHSRVGPPDRLLRAEATEGEASPDQDKFDQCIFINYHKIKTRKPWRPLKVIRAAAGPHELPSDSSDDEDESPAPLRESAKSSSSDDSDIFYKNFFDPLDGALDYILKNSDAVAACVSDRDLVSLFPTLIPTDVERPLYMLSPEVVQDVHGLGTLAVSSSALSSTHEEQVSGTPDFQMFMSEPPGQITVKVIQAYFRGRPSKSKSRAYVVVEFEQNEFVSHNSSEFEEGDKELRGAVAASLKETGWEDLAKFLNKPVWNEEVSFDVTSEQSAVTVSMYEGTVTPLDQRFLGTVKIKPKLHKDQAVDSWYDLEPMPSGDSAVFGRLRVQISFEANQTNRALVLGDFEIVRALGEGTAGRVFQVRKRDTKRMYAMKVLSKREITVVNKNKKQHVPSRGTLGRHTEIFLRTTPWEESSGCPFLVDLKFSFQTETDLYLLADFRHGGNLLAHLRSEPGFSEKRVLFYAAEIVLALEYLHKCDIAYRRLKPENVLLDATGHVALCDFGYSYSTVDLLRDYTTSPPAVAGAEYLAPEVLLDEGLHDSIDWKLADFWALGVLLFELRCGQNPFYAADAQQTCKNVIFGKLGFPEGAFDANGRLFVMGLLNRNVEHRLGARRGVAELKAHPFFRTINLNALARKRVLPPFVPAVDQIQEEHVQPERQTYSATPGKARGRLRTERAQAAAGDRDFWFTIADSNRGETDDGEDEELWVPKGPVDIRTSGGMKQTQEVRKREGKEKAEGGSGWLHAPRDYPYRPPNPAAPTSPRTTRRQMLKAELSEDLRRNLLHDRRRRTASGGGGGGGPASGSSREAAVQKGEEGEGEIVEGLGDGDEGYGEWAG